ncbi:hypothetical protein ACLOJK_037442 [Asimina triloba]
MLVSTNYQTFCRKTTNSRGPSVTGPAKRPKPNLNPFLRLRTSKTTLGHPNKRTGGAHVSHLGARLQALTKVFKRSFLTPFQSMDSETLEENKPEEEAVPATEETEGEGGKANDEVAAEEEAGGDEKADGEEEGEKKEDEIEEKKNKRKVGGVGGGRKRGKKEEVTEEKETKRPEGEEGEKKVRKRKPSVAAEPATPVERPARDRKRVERYSAPAEKSLSAGKSLEIKKGRGTQLKDIPNVAFKFSKRKTDDTLLTLHAILFGKKSTSDEQAFYITPAYVFSLFLLLFTGRIVIAFTIFDYCREKYFVKRNLSQFSGFVWGEDKERQRAKVKEKLDKCVKDKLLDFCDVLDIHVNKTTIRKEELSVKLMGFLESPHATTEVSLAEKEQV